ncbi:MAG: glycosyltransferase family 4 protein [Methylophaga sp.]
MNRNIKIARIATVPFFLDHQLKHQISDLIDDGFDVTAISSEIGDWSGLRAIHDLECVILNISRQPAPLEDLVSLFRLYRLFKKHNFDIIHSTTPKAGLLCAIAGWLARVPVRLHTFTGQTWATKTGFSKKLLRLLDKVIVMLNTRCYADSESQRSYLNSHGVGDTESIKVLGDGALAGVDLERFNSNKWSVHKHEAMAELALTADDFVITFIGRLSKEKGIYELLEAMEILDKRYDKLKLILVGPCEESITAEHLKEWADRPYIRHVGETNLPEKYLALSNLLCLPSYREGFGTVVIEAAAMRLPTVGTNITGLVDAVEDGETGVLVEPANVQQLVLGLEQLISNPKACTEMGQRAYQRCQRLYDSKIISRLIAAEYIELIQRSANE